MVTVIVAASDSFVADAKPVMLLIIIESPDSPRASVLSFSRGGPSSPLRAARLGGPYPPRRSRRFCFSLRLEELHLIKRCIDAISVQQIVMTPDLDDTPALEDDDRVGPHDRR